MEKNNIEEKPKGNLKSRKTIGMLLENTVGRSEYQVNFWTGVADKAKELDINLICFAGETLGHSPLNKFAEAQNIVYGLASFRNVDGLIISGTLGTYINEADFINFFSRFKSIPVVSTVVSLPGIPAVMVDNEKGMRELLTHLIQDHGYKHIGFIRGPKNNPDAEQRYEAYKKVLSEHNIHLDESIVVDGDFMSPSGAAAVDVLLKERMANFDVLIAANDTMALAALDALQHWGIHAPGKMAVVGFDDDNISRNITPSLTTVHHPKYELGQKAAEMLMALLVGEKVPDQVILSTNLIVRESCGCVDSVVAQAKAGLKSKAGTTIRIAIAASRQKILREIQEKIPNLSPIELAQADRVLRDFYSELKDETSPVFLSTLDDALRQVPLTDNSNIAFWHDVISSMRRNILPYIGEESMLFRAEDLWQQARVVIAKRARRVEGYRRLQAQDRAGKLSEINQALATIPDETELKNILVDKLPDLGIEGCYLSVYENPVMSTEQCHLVLAYKKEAGRVNPNPGDETFPVWQLTPRDILSQTQPYSLIVEPLCFQENQLGIVVFEMGPKNWDVYETLRGQISSALWGAHFTQLIRSLYEASSSVLSLQEPQAILDDVVEKACKAVGAKWANIVFTDKNKQHQQLVIGTHHGSSFNTSALISIEPVFIENMNTQTSLLYQQMRAEGIGAAGCFPLRVREKTVGVMWIFFEKPHRFAPAEVEALRLYVNQAAIAYDKAKRMKELEHLQQASEKLASVADVREVLQKITEGAHDVLQADSVAIWSYDASRKTFLPDELVTQGIPGELVEKSKLDKPSPGGTAEAVIREGYMAVTDVDHAQFSYLGPEAHGLRGAIGVKSFQGVVLKVVDEVLGVLYVNYRVNRGFDDEEETTLKTFAHHAALALKKARLLKRVRRISETARVVAEVSAQDDLQSTLKAIVEGTLNAFQCDAVTLNFYNPATNELGYPPAMAGVNHPERVQRLTRGEESIVHNMLLRKEPYIVEDVAQDADFKDRRFAKEEGTKSCVAIPLDAASQKVGVMFVNYRAQHHFTGQEIDDIKLFAYQAAVAIRSAQLYDDAMTWARHLLALSKAGTAVTSTLSLNEILVRIVEQVRLITGGNGEPARLVHLGLLEGTKLRIEAWRSSNPREPQNVIFLDLEHDDRIGIMGRVVKTCNSILLGDATQNKDYIEYDPTTHSELAVPILSGKKAIGVINAEHPDYGAFDEVDQQSLEALATYVAIAIGNARHVKEIEQRALQMRTASEVARDATSILNIEQLLDQAVNLISNRFHFYHIAIFLLDKGYAVLKAASSEGGKKMLQVGHKLKIGKDGIVGHVAQTGESRIVTDVNKDNEFLRNHYLADTCSEWALPLYVHGELIGVLDVQFNEPNVFFKEDITILEMMADQLAIAIHNARQYDELKQTKGLVGASTALAWMGMASSTWRHTIDKHARTIAEQIDLLRGELIQLNMSDNYPDLDRRLSLIWRLARQIEDKPITPPLSSEEGVVSVQVNVLIRERTGRLWESDPYKSFALKLYLVLSDKFTIRASPEWLRRAIDILIDNAVGAMADSSCREITIKTGQKDKWVEILISDTGKGIPPEVLPKIFVKPIEKAEGAKGLGMGLLMAQVIIQTYGGEIGVASTDSGGTAMFIRLLLEP